MRPETPRPSSATLQAIWLQGGRAYNLRALDRPPSGLDAAFFRPGEGGEPKGFFISADKLLAEHGADLHLAKDAILLLRWQAPELTPRPVTLQVDRRSESQEQRQRGREVVRLDP